MKTLSAFLTALMITGFAGGAMAMCGSYGKPAADQTADAPIILPDGSVGS